MADIVAEGNKTIPPPPTPAPSTRPLPRKRRSAARIILPIAIAILLVGGYFAWKHFSAYESTDDAEIDGHINAISARIDGHVIEVLTDDEKYVKAGDVLVRIDPRDYQVAVEKAEADLADAEAALEGSRTDIPITSTNTASQLKTAHSGRVDAEAALVGAQHQLDAAAARLETAKAQVREAAADYKKAGDDVVRYKLLVAKDEISQQLYDTAVATADAAKATVDARNAAVAEAEQNIRVAQSGVEEARTKIPQADATIASAMTAPQQVTVTETRAKSAQAQVAQRRALLDQAKLNLSYCVITAPVSGIVGKKTVEVGQNISPGQQLMAVVPLDDIWVTANFKETQLRHMKPGQVVKFSVDAYSREYTGKLEGVGGATGSKFSLLPPENATGNYVKVVQRIPVRLDIDPGQNGDRRLRPGMSVDPKVYVK
jgi:membrane fusion protein (multidrug efflux system)